MLREDEYNEGRKDARVDRRNKTKRPLKRYSPSYRLGYSEVYFKKR